MLSLSFPDASLTTCLPDQLPWAPWAMKGAAFKLLHADPASARFTLLIRLEPGARLRAHRHVGAVEGLVLAGAFHYREAPHLAFAAGAYLHEADGAVHQPVTPQGAVLFAVFHGPVEALDRQGRVIGLIDRAWHVDAWAVHLNAAPASFR